MESETKFSRERLLGARRFVEEEFEQFCNRAFVPRFARYSTHSIDAGGLVVLPHPDIRQVFDVTVGGETVESVFPNDDGGLLRVAGRWAAGTDVTVSCEHGMDRPPAPITRAFYTRVRNVIANLNSAIPDRATTFSSDAGGTYSLLTAGRGGSITAIPEVDVALREYQYLPALIG